MFLDPPVIDGVSLSPTSLVHMSNRCRFYASPSGCWFGERCQFSHSEISIPANSSASNGKITAEKIHHEGDLYSTAFQEKGPASENLTASLKPQEVALNSQFADPNPNSFARVNIPLCEYFARHGWCGYGSNCKYRHFTRNRTRSWQNTQHYANSSKSNLIKETGQTPNIGKDYAGDRLGRLKKRWLEKNDRETGVLVAVDIVPVQEILPLPDLTPQDASVGSSSLHETVKVVSQDLKSTPGIRATPRIRKSQRLCWFFESGGCRRGEGCPFQHGYTRSHRNEPNKETNNMAVVDTEKMRSIEIEQLRKRFTADKLREIINEDGHIKYLVGVCPTDPDWPYDVREVHLTVFFPSNYPKECLEVKVDEEHNASFPESLTRHMNKVIMTWIKERHDKSSAVGKVELMFRPFLHWFDRSLEETFTQGLKKAKLDFNAKAVGLEFVPYECLPGYGLQSNSPILERENNIQETEININSKEDTLDIVDVMENIQLTESPVENSGPQENINLNTAHRGTEIKLRFLDVGENVASLSCNSIKINISCGRCKTRHDVVTPANRTNMISCTKCHSMQRLKFRPALLHQLSAVLGYLDLEGCTAFDFIIVDSIFIVTCLSCNKQMNVDGIHYGQQRVTWCRYCNEKITLKVESFKFHILQPSAISGSGKQHVVQLPKIVKVKDLGIHEGKPLPNGGTCKHYKKSFRWFRFPCCGKAYPCDLCHNENEPDHEMRYANRVICGHCAKEQVITTNKPCINCNSSMTKGSTIHWEGGKGCRDKQKMSRVDKQKYIGLTKTVSRKKIEESEKSTK